MYGVYRMPFDTGSFGGSANSILRNVIKGWDLSGKFTYGSGTPLLITSAACTSSYQPLSGTCMPDLDPNYAGKTIRKNGSWGKGTTAGTLGAVSYLKGYISSSNQNAGSDNTTTCASSTGPYCNVQKYFLAMRPG